MRLALDHGRATVINADSAQVYRDLRVLSARPSDQDLRGVEHRLFGAWDGAQPCSAAEWAAAARREVAAAHEAGKLPIMVGGTGLYLRTLLDGIAPVPAIDPTVRREVRALPQSEARAALEREDPATAARLAPADRARTGRALEVIRATGRGLGEWQEARVGGIASEVTLHPLILLPNRARLYERCDARLATMMDAGAVEEVVKLLARGLDPHLPVMRAIGVREIAGWLRGEWTREHAVSSAQAATRRYAKRQFTWLRHQLPVDWPRLGKQDYVDRAKLARLFRV